MIHINRFIDKINAIGAKGQAGKQFPMTIDEARNLHSDITKLLLHLQQQKQEAPNLQDVTVEISGEKW